MEARVRIRETRSLEE